MIPEIAKRFVMMSDLENCVGTIIEVFHKYSSKEGDIYKLKKSELKELLTHEFPALIEVRFHFRDTFWFKLFQLVSHLFSLAQQVKDQATMDSLMESLDTDADSECDFQEFMTFITMVTICCHEFFKHEDEWFESGAYVVWFS